MDGEDPPTVLVVEDEETVADSYELYLKEICEITVASNGGEALVELGPEIDVVLLDRRMPGMTGDEVLDHIQDWELDCRVVMVSAVDPDLDVVDMGFDEYITKPVTKTELVEAVEQMVLLDRYEELFSEYHTVVKKLATLRSHFSDREIGGSDEIQELQSRRDDLRAEIRETIAGFEDEAMIEVFEDAHNVGESRGL